MTIAMKTLYRDVLDDFHQGPNDRNARVFVRAVNSTLDDLTSENDLATELAHITSTDSIVRDMTSSQTGVLYAGCAYYMVRRGLSPADPRLARIVYDDSETHYEKKKGDYWTDRVNDCQAVDSSSIIGLGYIS